MTWELETPILVAPPHLFPGVPVQNLTSKKNNYTDPKLSVLNSINLKTKFCDERSLQRLSIVVFFFERQGLLTNNQHVNSHRVIAIFICQFFNTNTAAGCIDLLKTK